MEDEAAAATEEEEAAGARKRKRGDDSGEDGAAEEDVGGGDEKGVLLLAEEDDDEEEEGCYEGIAEEAVAEVMRRLEAEISDDYYLAPALQPEAGKAEAEDEAEALGFVTINGNEESCGPSFSCAASTVMAPVDTRPGAPPPPPVPWPFPEAPSTTPAARKKLESTDDADVEMADDEDAWLAELLACGPLLEGFSL